MLDATNEPLILAAINEFGLATSNHSEAELHVGDRHAVMTFPFKDGAGEVAGLLIFVRDIQATRAEVRSGIASNLAWIGLVVLLGGGIVVFVVNGAIALLGSDPAYVVQLAEKVASGNLSETIPVATDDRRSLVATLAKMQAGLRVMVGTCQQSARELARAVAELKGAVQQASTATNAQSEAASGMAASVEQTSVSIDQVRDSAKEASKMADEAGHASRGGGQVIHNAAGEIAQVAAAVNEAAGTIHELESYSREISAVINVIREVADQTNLLALNAAIEAARAGDQGRGFAVVADEVRKLAERTTQSTHTIATVIQKVQTGARKAAQEMENGVARVNGSVDLANRAGDSVGGIQSSTDRVTAAVADIGHALDEQASAVQQVARGVERIANMAEENSASVRQTTAAVERLSVLAADLEESVARFKL